MAVVALLVLPAAALANPLAGWWPINEGGGQTVYDWSGNRNHGTLGSTPGVDANDPAWTQGLRHGGAALAFDGDDFVSVERSRSLEPRRITVSSWVRRESTPGAFKYIVAKGAQACSAASYGLYTGLDAGIAFYIFDGTSYHVSPAAPAGVWDGRWRHAAGTFDGRRVRLFLDGREVGSGTPVPAGTEIAYDLDGGDGGFGNYPGDCASLTLQGEIDSVRIWNTALPIELYWRIARALLGRS